MLITDWLVLIISTVLGTMSGLGIGGGSLLMVYLTSIQSYPLPQARLMNLLFFVPAAVISSVSGLRKGRIDFSDVIPASIAGCISAVLAHRISTNWPIDILKKFWGLFLIYIGVREIFYRERKAR